MIYIDTEYGSRTIEDALRELQIQLLISPDDGQESVEEVIAYCNSMLYHVSNLSNDYRELELVKTIIVNNTMMCDSYVEYVERITLDTKISTVFFNLEMNEDEIRDIFYALDSHIGGSSDNCEYDDSLGSYNPDCTIGNMLGIKSIKQETLRIMDTIDSTFEGLTNKERKSMLDELQKQMNVLSTRCK